MALRLSTSTTLPTTSPFSLPTFVPDFISLSLVYQLIERSLQNDAFPEHHHDDDGDDDFSIASYRAVRLPTSQRTYKR
jgi:hypothetical protein